MSTCQNRLVHVQGAQPRLNSVQIGLSVREVDILAVRGPTRVRRESNDSRPFELNAASSFVSGNTAGMDHAPDIEGGGSKAVDGLPPIYFNTSLPTRH